MNQDMQKMIFKKQTCWMLFFTAQITLNDANKPLPNLDPAPYRLESINISRKIWKIVSIIWKSTRPVAQT